MKLTGFCAAVALAAVSMPVAAQDDAQIATILDEGMNRSQVMILSHELMDGIGGRLTNSPQMRQAEQWALDTFNGWGLANVHKEGFEFGRGWESVDIEVDMIAPRPLELTAAAYTWTPGTNGVLEAPVVLAPIEDLDDLEAYRGMLRGKIALLSLPGTGDEPTRPAFRRLESSDFAEDDSYRQPTYDPDRTRRALERRDFWKEVINFLAEEGAVAWARKSYRDNKLLHGSFYTFGVNDTPKLPGIEIAAEDYRRLARFLTQGTEPVLRVDSQVRWHDGDTKAYNIIAEIPGTDPDAGYVMAGAHFDSWSLGDGAVDNGSGSVVVMEAARILKEMGVRPKSTIRFALWGAEEQGLIGSLNYAAQHLVDRPGNLDLSTSAGRTQWSDSWPIRKKAGYDQMKAYFNMDNGSGRFRGIYAEGNLAAKPLLSKWLSPFAALDATRVVAGNTGGTDHVYFQALGLPAFQFIQDPLDYSSRLHHTNIDTVDHMRPDDMRQNAVIMAAMLLQAADSAEGLPTEPFPQQPTATDPFKVDYPEDN